MSNLSQNFFHNIKIVVNLNDYWDVYLDREMILPYSSYFPSDLGDSLACDIDLCDNDCISGNTIQSRSWATWSGATTTDYTLYNIGYTGVDNGLINYRKDRITNEEFYRIYTQSKLDLHADDKRLHLHPVSGTTLLYEYPIHINPCEAVLNGGFFQGFFATECGKYQVLPTILSPGNTWEFDFTLKPEDLQKESERTLNDKYPENKGIFFYMGTRAENKWDYIYTDDSCFTLDMSDYIDDSEIDKRNYIIGNFNDVNPDFDTCVECESGEDPDCGDYLEDEVSLSDAIYETDEGIGVGENDKYTISTDNKFMFFDRTPTGFTTGTWDGSLDGVEFTAKKDNFNGNLFILMNRTSSGYTTENIDELRNKSANDYNAYADLYDNALAFRIADDGSVGYRLLTKDCDAEDHLSMKEGYSFSGVVPDNEWSEIHVKIDSYEKKMKIRFYVNGKLVYITDFLPLINLRKLNDDYAKQEGVCYNMSLGGGTQGLCETVLPNYMLEPSRVYPLEKYFAGSFIGRMKRFSFHDEAMEYEDINYIAKQ